MEKQLDLFTSGEEPRNYTRVNQDLGIIPPRPVDARKEQDIRNFGQLTRALYDGDSLEGVVEAAQKVKGPIEPVDILGVAKIVDRILPRKGRLDSATLGGWKRFAMRDLTYMLVGKELETNSGTLEETYLTDVAIKMWNLYSAATQQVIQKTDERMSFGEWMKVREHLPSVWTKPREYVMRNSVKHQGVRKPVDLDAYGQSLMAKGLVKFMQEGGVQKEAMVGAVELIADAYERVMRSVKVLPKRDLPFQQLPYQVNHVFKEPLKYLRGAVGEAK